MIKRVLTGRLIAFLVIILTLGFTSSTWAVISGPISLQTGFPLWYEDDIGNRVEICLACLADPVIAGDPFSEQIGFGAEAFWWIAGAEMDPAIGLVEFAMEAAWAAEVPNKGQWFPFTRIRIRLDTDLVGTYTIDHPFGTATATVDVPNAIRGVNISLDIPAGAPPAFLPDVAPGDTPTLFFAAGGVPFVDGQVFTGVGPIAAGAPLVRNTVVITGPAGSALDRTITDFNATGKYFESAALPRPNLAPTTTPDVAGVLFGDTTGITIDAAANDIDLIEPGVNDHGINPKATAIGMPDLVGPVPLVNLPLGTLELVPGQPVPTTLGGTVMKNSDGTFTYTPTATFTGEDTFTYTVQDTGGLVASETVMIRVENLTVNRAFIRVKTMKWEMAGQTTPTTTPPLVPHTITLHLGPDATGPVIGTADVQLDGSWHFRGNLQGTLGAARAVTCVSSNGAVLANQPFILR